MGWGGGWALRFDETFRAPGTPLRLPCLVRRSQELDATPQTPTPLDPPQAVALLAAALLAATLPDTLVLPAGASCELPAASPRSSARARAIASAPPGPRGEARLLVASGGALEWCCA